jgi:N,N'-diacetyllegionaminate synthase
VRGGAGKIQVGKRWIGPGEPCYIIAEAGSNHDGELERALALIEVASKAGADAVKFQGFRAATLYPPNAGRAEYLEDPRSIYEIIKAMEMPWDWVPVLAKRCHDRGLDFLCTPFDEEWCEVLAPHVPAFKIASYEISHAPLVRRVLAYGKPTFISTGASTLAEVGRVLELAREVGNEQIVFLQCTASYPAPPEMVNARAIVTLREATGCLVGLSDHSRDPLSAPVVAVALGAAVIEKHFTLSNWLPGPDHRFAVEPEELTQLVRAVRRAEAVLGTGVKEVQEVETELRSFARRSVFAVVPIRAGERLTEQNIRVLRNGVNAPGLPPEEYPNLLGRRAARDVPAGGPITREALDDAARLP